MIDNCDKIEHQFESLIISCYDEKKELIIMIEWKKNENITSSMINNVKNKWIDTVNIDNDKIDIDSATAASNQYNNLIEQFLN